MRTINLKINDWLLNTWRPSPFQLGLARILFCLGLYFMGLPEFIIVSTKDVLFFDPPPGISKIIGPISSASFWWWFDVVLRITFVAMFLGFKTKWASVLYGLLLIVGYDYYFSYGKIDHDIFAVIFPIIMAFSNWGASLSIDSLINKGKNIEIKGWPLTFFSFLLGWGYFTAGLPKLLGTWLDPYNSTTQGFILRKFYREDNNMYLIEWFAKLDSLLFYKFMDYATLVFELGFIVAIFSPKWFFKALAIAASFHLGVLLTLNIAFTMHVLTFIPFILIYFLSDSSQLLPATKDFISRFRLPLMGIGALVGFLIVFNFYPFAWFTYRSHLILVVLSLASMAMMIPRNWFTKVTKREKVKAI